MDVISCQMRSLRSSDWTWAKRVVTSLLDNLGSSLIFLKTGFFLAFFFAPEFFTAAGFFAFFFPAFFFAFFPAFADFAADFLDFLGMDAPPNCGRIVVSAIV
jgi:hypothetical protein